MKMKYLFLMILFGCGVEDISNKDLACNAIDMVTSLEGKEKTGLATIQSGSVSGNILSITFAYGGGCDPNHSFQLFGIPATEGKKINAVFAFNTNDGCKRLDIKTFCFDITVLKNKFKTIQIKGLKDALAI